MFSAKSVLTHAMSSESSVLTKVTPSFNSSTFLFCKETKFHASNQCPKISSNFILTISVLSDEMFSSKSILTDAISSKSSVLTNVISSFNSLIFSFCNETKY